MKKTRVGFLSLPESAVAAVPVCLQAIIVIMSLSLAGCGAAVGGVPGQNSPTSGSNSSSLSIDTSPQPIAAVLAITTAALPNGVEGSPYNAQVAVSGGTAPYTWSLISGSLPSSVALAATTGAISGTPSTTGTFTPTVQVADSANNTASRSYSFTLAAGDPPALSITTTTLPSAALGTPYSATLAAAGGQSPYQWSVTSGTLPAGLALNSSGVLSGTPTQSGTFVFTVSVTDSAATPQTATIQIGEP